MVSSDGRGLWIGSLIAKLMGARKSRFSRFYSASAFTRLFWLDRIPDHAAVYETVELAKELGFGAQAGFINALLRAYAREEKETASFWRN